MCNCETNKSGSVHQTNDAIYKIYSDLQSDLQVVNRFAAGLAGSADVLSIRFTIYKNSRKFLYNKCSNTKQQEKVGCIYICLFSPI